MAKQKGSAKTGGRKAGTPNKKTTIMQKAVAKQLKEMGSEEPLDVMLNIMNTPAPEPEDFESDPSLYWKALAAHVSMVFEAAKAAAPYRHARLSPTTNEGSAADEHISQVKQRMIDEQPA